MGNKSYRVGIDLGGTNIVAGVVDQDYNIIAKASCKTNVPRPEADVCDSMATIVKEAIKKAKLKMEDIDYIGIGVPGAVNPETRVIETSPNLFFKNWEIAKMMEERLHKYTKVENDANAAALGEFLAGSAKGTKNAIAITLGTGVGGGIVIDGKIYSGSNYAGAELGHMVIAKDGRECGCGRKGCWEAYASATALINMTKEAIRNEKAEFSYMLHLADDDIDNVNGKTAFDAQQAGDNTGKEVVEKYIEYLLGPLRSIIEKERFTKFNEKQTQVCIATLGNDAGIIGAASL